MRHGDALCNGQAQSAAAECPVARMLAAIQRLEQSRQVFRRDFVYNSQQLHALEASRRVQGIDRGVLSGALLVVEVQVESLKNDLRDQAAALRTLITDEGHAGTDAHAVRPARLQATIVSPYARLFVDLVRLADETFLQIECAWLLGLVGGDERARQLALCRAALQCFKETARAQRNVVGVHVRQVNEARRTARHDEADTTRPGEDAEGTSAG